jgi:tRNA(Ile)-lysidine synthase
MDRSGPFEPNPALAIAVSGGADSLALALLTHDWAARRRGTACALVVDHGLRPESAAEAQLTIGRLTAAAIPSTLLTLTDLQKGSALAERARITRYQALTEACRSAGLLHLLLGHHASDQAETIMMRALGNSLTPGLAAMPLVFEVTWVRLIRPLLATDPRTLREFLSVRGVGWVEDPSNRDQLALRARLRHRMVQHGHGTLAPLIAAVRRAGTSRANAEANTANELANRVTIRPEGFALLSPGRVSPAALANLIRTIGGAPYEPSLSQIAGLAADPRPATVAGVRILPARRLGDGFLVLREEAAMADPIPAEPNVVWDRRIRLISDQPPPAGTTIGKLGEEATLFRRQSPLPSAVLRTLPAIRAGRTLAAVPALRYAIDQAYARIGLLFDPPKPLAGATFRPI